ncbi:Acetyltransferase (GNAT) domain protein [uncultured archaeon]|nr:Acetyltransferase (GNAT) domain protein [uncultured archaeon]
MIKLSRFDKKFYESLPEKEEIYFVKEGKYYTLFFNTRKIGVVGFTPVKNTKEDGFVQIVLLKEFRGKGLVEEAEMKLVKRCKLRKLYATIQKNNLASIKAHKKIGFKILPKEKIEELREKSFLKPDQVRLEKVF